MAQELGRGDSVGRVALRCLFLSIALSACVAAGHILRGCRADATPMVAARNLRHGKAAQADASRYLPAPTALTGRVLRDDGSPAAGASVQVFHIAPEAAYTIDGHELYAKTDSRGYFEFPSPFAGRKIVVVTLRGCNVAALADVVCYADMPRTVANVTLQRGSTANYSSRWPDGSPGANTTFLVPPDYPGGQPASVVADHRGNLAIPPEMAIANDCVELLSGNPPVPVSVHDGELLLPEIKTVTLAFADDLATVDVLLRTVAYERVSFRAERVAIINKTGSIANLPDHSYRIALWTDTGRATTSLAPGQTALSVPHLGSEPEMALNLPPGELSAAALSMLVPPGTSEASDSVVLWNTLRGDVRQVPLSDLCAADRMPGQIFSSLDGVMAHDDIPGYVQSPLGYLTVRTDLPYRRVALRDERVFPKVSDQWCESVWRLPLYTPFIVEASLAAGARSLPKGVWLSEPQTELAFSRFDETQPGTFAICGFVLDANGFPARESYVVLAPEGGRQLGVPVDSFGYFVFPAQLAGEYTLIARSLMAADGDISAAQAFAIELIDSSAPVVRRDVTLFSCSLRVLPRRDEIWPEQVLVLTGPNVEETWMQTRSPVSIRNLPPGRYRIAYHKSGELVAEVQVGPGEATTCLITP